jgi:UDP-N-acetylmuramyl pentapeptide phosphotransferase/UDP-N-acetylglucosamine-1-phosphate transferase
MLGILGLAGLASFGLTRLLCSPASSLYPLDHPNERSLHSAPMPRTGGLAILGGLTLGFLAGYALEWPAAALGTKAEAGIWILGVTFIVGAVSFWDDRAGLSPGFRLTVQTLAAAGVVGGGGMVMTAVAVPFLGSLSLGWFAVPVTILFLVWMANLYNFMDGMDGFAGGMTVLGYGFLGCIAWNGGHTFIMVLAFLIAASAAGFLVFNLPPARIFMGDVGSVPLGFLAAALTVMGTRDGLFDIWVPLLVFSPFVADATVTLARRLMKGEKVWHAHRKHYYQRLVLAGWGHRRTVMVEYALMLACGLSAVAYGQVGELWRFAILLAWMGVYLLLAGAVHRVEGRTGVVRAAG